MGQWSALLLLYAILGGLLWSTATIYGQGTSRFGSGSRFGNGTTVSESAGRSAIDALQDADVEQNNTILAMRGDIRFNTSRIDVLEHLDLPAQMAVVKQFMLDAQKDADDLRRLGTQILGAVAAGIIVQIVMMKRNGRRSPDEMRDLFKSALQELQRDQQP